MMRARPARAFACGVFALLMSFAGDVAAQTSRVLTGFVVAADDRSPVVGAEVRVPGLDVVAVTASDGAWRIGPVPPGRIEVVVAHIGYASARLAVDAEAAAPLRIELTPSPLALSAMVITASRRTQQLKDAPVATELIDRAELRRSGASDLSAVLIERTGIAVEGGHPVGTGVMLQGLGSERVLILLDGQPLQGRIAGNLDLSRLPVSMIERVEVVKGPQSTLYGSDAMGGVVNIITRDARTDLWLLGVDVTGGSRNRLDVALNTIGGIGDVGYAIDGGRRTIELVPGHPGESATYATRLDGAAKLAWQAAPSVTLNAGGTILDEAQRWRSGALYTFADNRQLTGRAGATITHGGLSLRPTIYATEFLHLSRRSTLPQPVAGSGEEERQRLLEGELLVSYDAGALMLDGGVEARRESIDSDRVEGAARTLHAVEPFVQATFGGDRLGIVPGVRVSWSEQWGTHVTPRIATMFRPTPRLALRLSAGQGFRAPSFKEMYMDFLNSAPGAGYRVEGNRELQPETSRNLSGSIEWAGERLYARAQLFYNRFDDFIETVEIAGSDGLRVFTYGNIDDGMTLGSELELGATWRALRAELGYGWLVAEDRGTGERLPNRPPHSARASLGYAHTAGLRLTLSGVHTARTLVSRTDSGDVYRDAFSRLDVRASQLLPHGFELSAGIDNITAEQPEHWPGYVSRQFHVALGWQANRAR